MIKRANQEFGGCTNYKTRAKNKKLLDFSLVCLFVTTSLLARLDMQLVVDPLTKDK